MAPRFEDCVLGPRDIDCIRLRSVGQRRGRCQSAVGPESSERLCGTDAPRPQRFVRAGSYRIPACGTKVQDARCGTLARISTLRSAHAAALRPAAALIFRIAAYARTTIQITANIDTFGGLRRRRRQGPATASTRTPSPVPTGATGASPLLRGSAVPFASFPASSQVHSRFRRGAWSTPDGASHPRPRPPRQTDRPHRRIVTRCRGLAPPFEAANCGTHDARCGGACSNGLRDDHERVD